MQMSQVLDSIEEERKTPVRAESSKSQGAFSRRHRFSNIKLPARKKQSGPLTPIGLPPSSPSVSDSDCSHKNKCPEFADSCSSCSLNFSSKNYVVKKTIKNYGHQYRSNLQLKAIQLHALKLQSAEIKRSRSPIFFRSPVFFAKPIRRTSQDAINKNKKDSNDSE